MDTTVRDRWEDNADAWSRHVRAGYDVYRDALNTPAFLAILPDVAGAIGLDIGCGEGANTRSIARCGAIITGIDFAPTFIKYAEEAETAEPLGIRYHVANAAALPFADASFDFATAFMSLMDMPRQDLVLKEVCRVLKPGGFLQFTILHPCFAPPHRKVLRDTDGRTRAIEVGRYFDLIDGQEEVWHFSTLPASERAKEAPFRTPRFHRTLSVWVEMILSAGFAIEAMHEPTASPELAAREPVVEDTLVAPMSLIVRCRVPA